MLIKQTNYPQTNFTALPKFAIQVDEHLLRGKAILNPKKFAQLKKEGVTQIIDLRNTSLIRRPIEKLMCLIFGIKYINYKYPHRLNYIPSEDFFEKINEKILSNPNKTYIHCQYGKRRTGICVAIYEKLHTKKSNDEILSNLLNLGFQEILYNIKSYKTQKLNSIYQDFLSKYINQ